MRYKIVVEILQDAARKINEQLTFPEDEHHRIKLTTNLKRDADYISLITGVATFSNSQLGQLGPATSIGGVKIERLQKEVITAVDLEPEDEAKRVFKEKVEYLYDNFLNLGTANLLTDYEHIYIRGVAKKAKMRVTLEQPESITPDFIEEIKLNIRKMHNRAEAIEAARLADEAARTPALEIEQLPDDNKEDETAAEAEEEKKQTRKSPQRRRR